MKKTTSKARVVTHKRAGKAAAGADYRIVVGLGSCGIAAGGHKVKAALLESLRQAGTAAQVSDTGCVGMCYREVLMDIHQKDGRVYTYGNMTPDRMPRL